MSSTPTTLQFTGTDYRGLIDVLIQAVELSAEGRDPTIEVNGRVYTELLKVAELLPEDDLLPHHQAKIHAMFQKKQRGYRRTAVNLAHRSNQIASNRSAAMAMAYIHENCKLSKKQREGMAARTIVLAIGQGWLDELRDAMPPKKGVKDERARQ